MSRLLRINLSAMILATMSLTGTADRNNHPDLSCGFSGKSLEWPGADTENIYKTAGRYIARNIIATRNQIYKDEAIIALPRYKRGVPFTLGAVKLSKRSNNDKPNVAPFPSWPLQEEDTCDPLQSAVDLFLDVDDILWVLDAGIVNTLEQPIRRCSPKVVGINVKTRKVVKIIDLSNLVSAASRLQYLVVDRANDGKTFIYVSDSATRAIIVYDVMGNRGFRVVLPKAVTLGCDRRDVLYMILVKKRNESPVLYFTYLCSDRVFSMDVKNLRQGIAGGEIVDVGPKNNKIVLLGADNDRGILFRYKGQSDIYMWNVDSKFIPDHFILVQRGNDDLFPTQVTKGNKRLLWVMESNFHDYIDNTVGCTGATVLLRPLVKSAEYS